jgi:hypothetical protein
MSTQKSAFAASAYFLSRISIRIARVTCVTSIPLVFSEPIVGKAPQLIAMMKDAVANSNVNENG